MSLEHLEDRRLLTTFLVTSAADLDPDGVATYGSLRWALGQTNAEDDADEIVFADSLFAFGGGFGTTIGLNGGQLNITQPVRILGPGPGKLTIQQTRNNNRLFDINIGAADEIFGVEISGVTLSNGNLNGNAARGGAIYNRERLTMVETIVENNSAAGGGGIYVEFGGLAMDRSLVQNNSAGIGGGIMNGSAADDNFPNSTITNSTLTGNVANGIPGDDGYLPYGGAIFNRNGRLTITSSTIVDNSAGGGMGAGVASWGNEPPEPMSTDPPPPETVFTFVSSSILYHNLVERGAMPVYDDIAVVGVTDDDPPLPLLPSVTSRGYNIIGMLGDQVMLDANDLPEGTDPEFLPDLDMLPGPDDYGGTTNVFMLSDTSPALDAADPEIGDLFEQRGRHYTRIFDYTGAGAIADIGAVERQAVSFVVDELYDESETEGQTAGVYEVVDIDLGQFNVLGYEAAGDFTIREALAYARKNTDASIITFSPALQTREFENDPNSQTSPATITLTLGQLTILTDTVIQGPTTFILEIDASGNDVTPNAADGNGTRVLEIGAGVNSTISNLTFKGGDINSLQGGGGILSNGNFVLIDSTIKENDVKGDGGGIAIRGGTFDVSGTTFKNNFAATNGGALYVGGTATVNVTNSTFSGNNATGRGGAIVNANADLTILFSTITLNTASTTRGSGVYTLNGASAATKIGGSIVARNAINDVEYATGAAAKVTSLGYNLVNAGNALPAFTQTGDLNPNTDPMLEPLLNTGGQTETHRPKETSPIIDAGDLNVAGAPTYDQRGAEFARVFDGNGDSTAQIDIGAYELQSSTFVVSTDQDENDGNYTYGFLSLREAIKLANDNPRADKITFDPLLIALTSEFALSAANLTINDSADMKIRTSMTIEGPGSALLALNGAGLTHPLFPLLGPSRIFTVDNGNSATLIDVTITGLGLFDATSGSAGGAILSRENLTLDDLIFVNNHTVTFDALATGVLTPGLHGGAIYQQGASLTINNSTLTGNYTDSTNSDGGAIYAVNATVNFLYSTISGNSTLKGNSEGGGLALKSSTLVASEMTIIGNSTSAGLSDGGGVFLDSTNALFEESAIGGNFTTGSNSEGGGLYVTGATSQVALEKNTTLSFNRTAGTQASGGGAYVNGGTLAINSSAIIQNTTTGASAFGGGAAAGAGGTLSITGTRVHLNTVSGAGSGGGGIANLSGNVNIRNSTLSNNQALHTLGKGGGVYSDTNLAGTQTTTILNSTISGNTAGVRGGGVFNADGTTAIRHSTITNNSTPYFNAGNGLASQANASTRTIVESSIIAGNAGVGAGTGTDVDSVDSAFVNSLDSQGYNVIGVGNNLGEFIQPGDKTGIINPGLGALANNGGLTQTHAVQDGSPAVNAGKPSFNANAFTPPLTTDQRGAGFARVLGGRIDAGAYESAFTGLAADFDLNNRVDGNDLLTWQRFNGLQANATKSQGDANGDGKVNGADLAIIRAQFGMTAAEIAAIPAVVGGGDDEPVAAASIAAIEPQDEPASGPPAVATVLAATSVVRAIGTPNYAPIASAGVPGAAALSRTAYRPALDRNMAARDAAHAVPGSQSSRIGDGAGSLARRSNSRFGDSAACDRASDESSVSAEDSVFALLGEGLL